MLRQYLNLPRSIHVLCLGSFINRAGTFVIIFLTLYLQDELDLGVRFATRAMGVFGLGAILGALGGGYLADQIGRRIVMLAALFGGAVLLVVFSFITTPWAIMLTVLIFAIVAEMYRPAASAMIADLTKPSQRSHAFGLMYVSINLGFAVGAFVGGLIANYDFQWLFWGDALTTAIYGIIIFAAIRETLPVRASGVHGLGTMASHDEAAGSHVDDADAKNAGARIPSRTSSPQESPPAEAPAIPLRAAARHIMTDTPFIIFCLGTFLAALVFMQAMSTFPLYMKWFGFSPGEYGMVIALNGILIVCLQLPLTTLFNRYNRAFVVVVGAILQATGFGLICWAVSLWHFALTVVLSTVGEMMMAPYSPAIVSDLAPTRLRARYMGVFTMSFSSSMMFSAPIGGEILNHPGLGGQWLWRGSFVVGIVAAGLYFSVRRHIVQKRD